MVPRCFMPARIWIGIWRPERSRRMSRASDFFYKFQGIPLSVGTELGVSLGGPQACMPHQLADGVQRDILTGQPRAKGTSQGVDNDFEPGIGDTVVQAKNVYGLRKGMGQGIGPDLKSFAVVKTRSAGRTGTMGCNTLITVSSMNAVRFPIFPSTWMRRFSKSAS